MGGPCTRPGGVRDAKRGYVDAVVVSCDRLHRRTRPARRIDARSARCRGAAGRTARRFLRTSVSTVRGGSTRPRHRLVALGVQPRQALGGGRSHDSRRTVAPRRARRGERRPVVDGPADRDAVRLRRARRGQPGLGGRGAVPVRARWAQGELGGIGSHRLRCWVWGCADRRRRPGPVALGVAPGVPARRGRHGSRSADRAGRAPAIGSRSARRRVGPGLVPAVLLQPCPQPGVGNAEHAPLR